MNKAVLISIHPRHCANIANGQKTIEVRKDKPKWETPFKCYIYCTIYKPFKARKHLYINEERVRGQYKVCDWWCDYGKDEIVINDYDERAPKWLRSTKFTAYKAERKVIGKFVCDEIYEWKYECDGVDIDDETLLETRLDWEEINIYAHGKTLYGWHISELKIYDKPKELSEFLKPCKWRSANHGCFGYECEAPSHKVGCQYAFADRNPDWSVNSYICGYKDYVTRPPQSWMYVEGIDYER